MCIIAVRAFRVVNVGIFTSGCEGITEAFRAFEFPGAEFASVLELLASIAKQVTLTEEG